MKKILKPIGLMSIMLAVVTMGFGSSVAQALSYTTADVATHNTPTDCWVIVKGNVYNLTSFAGTHSGGSSVINAQCGKNGTASFNSGPHSASTLNAISSSLLGPLTTTTVSPILTSVKIVPSTPTLIIGGTVELKATSKDQNQKKFIGATTTFSSSNPAVATVNSTSGLVTGVSVGSTTITATSVSGTISITGTSTVKVSTTTINKDKKGNNGKHLGQYKNWYKKWFKDHEDKWEKRNEKNERSNHQDDDDDENEENDD